MSNELEIDLFGRFVFSGNIDKVKEMIDSGIDLNRIKWMDAFDAGDRRRSAADFGIIFEKRRRFKQAIGDGRMDAITFGG